MTREEAITVLKAFMENPLFSDAHKQAFNIAIHDIKQRHDWDINKLMLVNKDNYEPQEPILDKVRAEIERKLDNINRLYNQDNQYDDGAIDSLQYALDIIDKYRESEE